MKGQNRILNREGIKKELNNVFDYALTVAVAAMGYGKTTVARDFFEKSKTNTIWLSVENDEWSVEYIWDSFMRQLSKVFSESGKLLNELGFPKDAPQRNRIIRMLENYIYQNKTVLVIDDYHFAHCLELDELIERIVRANIPHFHILLLSRSTPEINIEELMLKNYCYLIKNDLFELSEDEVWDFFKLYHIHVSKPVTKQVHKMSEGWISAVYLMMQRYIESGKLKTGSSIEKLIETTILKRYNEKEIKTMISLSILDSFTLSQAEYVTNDNEASKTIKKLIKDNSFIRYDELQETYKIHNILSSYLKKIFDSEFNDEQQKNLYKRAGQWYLKNESILNGLAHLLKAQEYALILKEFEKRSITKVIDNNPKFILNLFNHIPDEMKYRYPYSYLNYLSFYVTNVDREVGEGLLLVASRYYKNDEEISLVLKRRILGEIQLISSYLSFNDSSKMYEKQLKAYKLLDGNSKIANSDKIATYGCPHILYMYHREKGKVLWVAQYLLEKYRYYEELSNGCGAGFGQEAMAEYYLETGDLKQAEIYAYKAIYKAQSMGQTDIVIAASLTLSRIACARFQFYEAMSILDNVSVLEEVKSRPILSSAYELCVGYIACIIGDEKSVPVWIKIGDIAQSEVLYQGMGLNYILYAKWVLCEKNYIKLEILCEEMLKVFSRYHNQLGYFHAYLLDAIAKYNLYGVKKAKNSIIKVLEIGKADKIVTPISEYGEHIYNLILELKVDIIDDVYFIDLLKKTKEYNVNLNNFRESQSTIVSLTNREKEILNLLVEGKRNKEIAQELFIAEITVKKSITSIYQKLNVKSRISAIKKAMKLKLLLKNIL